MLVASRTIYLDSAGDPGWLPPFGKSQVRWYVLAGVALTPEADLDARKGIDTLLEKYVPPLIRAQFPPQYYEIHYHDIIRGHNLFKHLTHQERKDLSDGVFTLIKSLKPVLFATAIDKLKLKQRYGERAYSPRRLAIQSTLHRFSMYLDRENFIGSAIMDEEEFRKDKELREMINTFRKFGITIRGWNYNPSKENKLERVLNTVQFTPSHTSPGIQLADVCSRATFLHFERTKSNRFFELKPFWDAKDSKVYEPSVVPKL
jgi:hypothetical protein